MGTLGSPVQNQFGAHPMEHVCSAAPSGFTLSGATSFEASAASTRSCRWLTPAQREQCVDREKAPVTGMLGDSGVTRTVPRGGSTTSGEGAEESRSEMDRSQRDRIHGSTEPVEQGWSPGDSDRRRPLLGWPVWVRVHSDPGGHRCPRARKAYSKWRRSWSGARGRRSPAMLEKHCLTSSFRPLRECLARLDR